MGRVRFTAKLSRLWRGFSTLPIPGRPPANHIDLGRHGERVAERFLKRHKHKILHRNYRAPHGGEVDLVCRDRAEDTLVFVEVKTRQSARAARPREAVDHSKQYLVAKGAMSWLTLLDKPNVVFRFDIVEVVLDEPHPIHIRDAFHLPYPFRH